MSVEELAHRIATEYGRSLLGDWMGLGELLWSYDLPSGEADIVQLDLLYRAALGETA